MKPTTCFAVLPLALAACGSAEPGPFSCPDQPAGTTFRHDPTLAPAKSDAARWLAFPFPSDHRRTDAGTIRVADMPDPYGSLMSFKRTAETDIVGFSPVAPVHFSATANLNVSLLPTDAAAFRQPNAVAQLVDITSGSPTYGERWPLRWEYRASGKAFVAPHTLSVAPEWGFPLPEDTTFAMILTTGIQDAAGAPLEQAAELQLLLEDNLVPGCLTGDIPAGGPWALHARWAPLRDWLDAAGIPRASVVAATVYTTQDITSELGAIYQQVAEELPAPAYEPDAWQDPLEDNSYHTTASFQWNSSEVVTFHVMEGRFMSPNYQAGEIPYATEGGTLNVVNGTLTPYTYEHLRFFLVIPDAPPATASGCYPIVEYAHGTGGSAKGFTTSGSAARMAAHGIASIGLDQPMHGLRAAGKTVNYEAHSFNVLNPDSSRANFRQSAIDTFSLTRFVRESLQVPADKDPRGLEQAICFDTEHIGFFGHSHGGLSGALAAAFEPHVRSWVLSGGGGGISITVNERSDIDLRSTVILLLGLDDTEPLTEMHPALTLLQTVVDITDPINYAPYWLTPKHGLPPASFLVTSGELDNQTPYRTATYMALAGKVPQVQPVQIDFPEYAVAGIAALPSPASGNVAPQSTAGFVQWVDDGANDYWANHYVIFNRPEAIEASMTFLQTATAGGTPQIVRNASSDAR